MLFLQVSAVEVGCQTYLEHRERGVETKQPEWFRIKQSNTVSH